MLAVDPYQDVAVRHAESRLSFTFAIHDVLASYVTLLAPVPKDWRQYSYRRRVRARGIPKQSFDCKPYHGLDNSGAVASITLCIAIAYA
eukprot:SAG31_NODE_25323_length_463_cov_1.406593_1_plen_88_part_01